MLRRRLRPLVISTMAATWLSLAPVGCRQAAEPAGPPAAVVEGMNHGVSLMGQYLYDDAAKAFEEVLTAAPHLSEARINLAIALFNRNHKEDIETAEKLLATVLLREPGNVRALYFQAILLQHVGKAEQAIPCLETVVQERADDGAAWYLLALCKQRVGQPAEADFLRAVQRRPYLYSAYYQLYQTAMRAGQDTKAQEYLGMFKTLRASPLGESIELPQYNQMGDLALTRPLPTASLPPLTKSQYRLKTAATIFTWAGPARSEPDQAPPGLNGAAIGDLDRDGRPDLVVPLSAPGRVVLLRQTTPGGFVDATDGSGLEPLSDIVSCAIGDCDNDDVPDLFLAGTNGHRLLKGKGDGTFTDITRPAGLETEPGTGRAALFLDADHDGDLDLFVCDARANRLWNNNGDGAFTNLASQAAIACPDGGSRLILPGDVDGDRDQDLILLRQDQPAKLFLNELLGRYGEADLHGLDLRGDAGGVLQDFNGDQLLDLVVLGGTPPELKLFVGDGRGSLKPDEVFGRTATATASWGPMTGFRVGDVDLDGDLDLAAVGSEVHLLLNDGRGLFVLQAQVWQPATGSTLAGIEWADLTGDLVPDLLLLEHGATNRVRLALGELVPPATALAIQPSGIRSRDGRTRSPASGYGVTLTVRAGLREQRVLFNGQSGGLNQSLLPVVFGLSGAGKADSVDLTWPDGVAQAEMALVAGQTHKVAELQRKISSCPVLFAWNGTRFQFVTDFAGVGGLGYFSAPGVAAPPQVLEHVKIESNQLRARDGAYDLRVTEPMEEAAYIDRLELVAIDHAANRQVFPDERLAIQGPPPTHELLVVDEPIRPLRATDPSGRDCTDNLARVDRVYAYDPPLDRRYIGFCRAHTLELDFADRLGLLAGAAGSAQPPNDTSPGLQPPSPRKTARTPRERDRVYLFINGFIEYPYSQTVYAAGQSRLGWEPLRVECQGADGSWRAIVPDGGAPGGMGRMMTIELTGLLLPATSRLRLTTNLELFYDQIFVARLAPSDSVTVRTAPLLEANLRYVGFARESSPDGRLPLIYDYDLCDAAAPFHTLKGAYTRYGPVEDLLRDCDDRYALLGPGDELALKFDATHLPDLAPGRVRSFVLVSHAYCKDMDLYTATPRTLEPLPFRAMSRYPYPATEQYPTGDAHQAFLRTYNTRILE